MLLANVLGKYNVELTVGKTGDKWPYGGCVEGAKKLGASIKECEVHEVCVDKEHNIVTSPAYMYDG